MADESAGTDGGPPPGQEGWVRPEAAARIANDRDKLRARVAELEGRPDVTALERGYQAFKGLEGFTGDPFSAAKAAVQSGAVSWDPENPAAITEQAKGWWDSQRSMLGIQDQPPASDTDKPKEETVQVSPPGTAGPSPANGGGAPPAEKLTWESPEVQKLYKSGNWPELRKIMSDPKRYEVTPGSSVTNLTPTPR